MTRAHSAPTIDVDPDATIKQSPFGFMGSNAILLSVSDLDRSLDFYQRATGFRIQSEDTVSGDQAMDRLYCADAISFRRAILQAPNMLLELYEFEENSGKPTSNMPVEGPGMTHTCYQTPSSQSGYDRFKQAGARILSTGAEPIDLGGYGVTYAYAHDPDGNMLEMEQLDPPVLKHMGYYQSPVLNEASMWLSQIALVSPDLDRLMRFYASLLGIAPSRRVEVKKNRRADAIGGLQDAHILGGWFQLNDKSKVLELWQYIHPKTEAMTEERHPRSLGYCFVLEVSDIAAACAHMATVPGARVLSEPVTLDDCISVYCKDIDGNVFCLRELRGAGLAQSVSSLDR